MQAVVSRHALAILMLVIACGVAETVFVLMVYTYPSKGNLRPLVWVHKVRRLATTVTAICRLERCVTCVVRRHYHSSWAMIISPVASLIVSTCWSIEYWVLLVDKVRPLSTQHFVLALAWLTVTTWELVATMVAIQISSWLARMAPETRIHKAWVHHLMVCISLAGMALGKSGRGRHCMVKAMTSDRGAPTHVLRPIATRRERSSHRLARMAKSRLVSSVPLILNS